MSLTIVGLGPGGKEYLTLEAIEAIRNAESLYYRTLKHPVTEYIRKEINPGMNSFDNLYDSSLDFEEVYRGIADEVLALSEKDDVTYCVPGNPVVAERTVELILEQNPDARIVYGVSFVDAMISALKIDPVSGLNLVDALSDMNIDPRQSQLIMQVYDRLTASALKLRLMEYYDDEADVAIVKAAGVEGLEEIKWVKLYELDRYEGFDYLTSVFVKKPDESLRKWTVMDLVSIMEKLRSEDGCPWDRKQTHESLREYVLEEAGEVAEAIDSGDMFELEEELGDLLLQVVFHSTIAKEKGDFIFEDVTNGICEKLIRRHPHVFGDESAHDEDDVKVIWERIKAEEKNV